MENDHSHTDKELFALIARGDGTAFATFFRLYYDRMRWNALRILKSEYWAEEVVQEVYLQLWTNRDALTNIDAPAAYIFRMVANRCFDRIRKNDLDIRAQYSLHLLLPANASDMQYHHYDLTVLKSLMQEILEKLPQQQRLIYTMQSEESLSYQEIADKLGLSRNTVRNHMARAIQTVRSYIEQHGGDLFIVLLCLYHFC